MGSKNAAFLVHRTSYAVALLLAAAVGCGRAGDVSRDSGVSDSPAGNADAAVDAALDAMMLTCYDFSLDVDVPIAFDGVFGAATPTWRRPHDDEPVCPATGLLPATAALVPFAAYALCNNTAAAHTFDFEMLSTDGPAGEPPLDDPYLILYTGNGIPGDARGCLAVNDDIEGALDTKDSELLGIDVPPGGAITVVLTTYTFAAAESVGTGSYVGVITVAD